MSASWTPGVVFDVRPYAVVPQLLLTLHLSLPLGSENGLKRLSFIEVIAGSKIKPSFVLLRIPVHDLFDAPRIANIHRRIHLVAFCGKPPIGINIYSASELAVTVFGKGRDIADQRIDDRRHGIVSPALTPRELFAQVDSLNHMHVRRLERAALQDVPPILVDFRPLLVRGSDTGQGKVGLRRIVVVATLVEISNQHNFDNKPVAEKYRESSPVSRTCTNCTSMLNTRSHENLVA